MYQSNAREEYVRALKLGQKECRELAGAGMDPYPAVLDRVLPGSDLCPVQDLPAMEIPVERIVVRHGDPGSRPVL